MNDGPARCRPAESEARAVSPVWRPREILLFSAASRRAVHPRVGSRPKGDTNAACIVPLARPSLWPRFHDRARLSRRRLHRRRGGVRDHPGFERGGSPLLPGQRQPAGDRHRRAEEERPGLQEQRDRAGHLGARDAGAGRAGRAPGPEGRHRRDGIVGRHRRGGPEGRRGSDRAPRPEGRNGCDGRGWAAGRRRVCRPARPEGRNRC